MIEKREEIDLAAYGFDGRFAALAGEYDSLVAGRILSQEKGLYRVISGMGEQLAEVSGKFQVSGGSSFRVPGGGMTL